MKKGLKRMAALIMGLAMVLSLPMAVSAAEPAKSEITIQLDGKTLDTKGVDPILKDGRTYIPFRAIFEAMGAEVGYEDVSKTVYANKGDTAVSFVIGSSTMSVKSAFESNSIDTDAASFIDGGYTYVPVRFAAQALGANVGWDAESKTVVIIDTDKLMSEYDGKFTVIDKMLKSNEKYMEGTYAFTGSMNIDIEVNADGEIVPIALDGKMTGMTDTSAMDMNLEFVTDFESALKMLGADEEMDDETKAMLDSLKNIEMEYIVNLEAGKYYFTSPLFSTLLGVPEGTWMSMDMNKIMGAAGMGQMSSLMDFARSTSCAEILGGIIKMMPVDDDAAYTDMKSMLDVVESILSDAVFTKTGDVYKSEFTFSQDGADMNGTLSVNVADEKNVTYDLTAEVKQDGAEIMTITASQLKDNVSTVNVVFNMEGLMKMTMAMDMQYSKSTGTVKTAPPSSAMIMEIPFGEME